MKTIKHGDTENTEKNGEKVNGNRRSPLTLYPLPFSVLSVSLWLILSVPLSIAADAPRPNRL